MNESNLLHLIQQEFHQLNRKLTYATVAIVCICAMIFYWMGLEVKGNAATIVGAMFIILAVFTFQIPYISYRYMLKKYQDEPEKLAVLGPQLA